MNQTKKWMLVFLGVVAFVLLATIGRLAFVGEILVSRVEEQGQRNREMLQLMQEPAEGATVFRSKWVDQSDPLRKLHIVEVRQRKGELPGALLVRYKEAIRLEETTAIK